MGRDSYAYTIADFLLDFSMLLLIKENKLKVQFPCF